jgi:hypothetical protein
LMQMPQWQSIHVGGLQFSHDDRLNPPTLKEIRARLAAQQERSMAEPFDGR